jgi:hypothetical protein
VLLLGLLAVENSGQKTPIHSTLEVLRQVSWKRGLPPNPRCLLRNDDHLRANNALLYDVRRMAFYLRALGQENRVPLLSRLPLSTPKSTLPHPDI